MNQLARGIREAIGGGLGQQVVVKNVPGGSGSIGEILERQKYSISYQGAAAFKASVEADDKRMGELIKSVGLAKK
jgi:tripartite-type tricarboxylate transporter receptor subunit TctC